jgi:molybdate transport system substrate-binding protein
MLEGMTKQAIAVLMLVGVIPMLSKAAGPEAVSVAAAANLNDVFNEIAAAFTKDSGIPVSLSFGATAQLTRQIENAAPFDVFAAADRQHIDELREKQLIVPGSDRVYARGSIVLWCPATKATVNSVRSLTQPSVRFIAVAKPETAPYGRATVEALQALHLWDALQPKVVYAENITAAKQYAATGNADCGFVAKSLLIHESNQGIPVDEKLYRPIDQALAVLKSAKDQAAASRFAAFVTGPKGEPILTKFGYTLPKAQGWGMVGSR